MIGIQTSLCSDESAVVLLSRQKQFAAFDREAVIEDIANGLKHDGLVTEESGTVVADRADIFDGVVFENEEAERFFEFANVNAEIGFGFVDGGFVFEFESVVKEEGSAEESTNGENVFGRDIDEVRFRQEEFLHGNGARHEGEGV